MGLAPDVKFFSVVKLSFISLFEFGNFRYSVQNKSSRISIASNLLMSPRTGAFKAKNRPRRRFYGYQLPTRAQSTGGKRRFRRNRLETDIVDRYPQLRDLMDTSLRYYYITLMLILSKIVTLSYTTA